MDKKRRQNLIDAIVKVFSSNDRVLFAYLYGSALSGFLEQYGWKFRECEGLIQEVLA